MQERRQHVRVRLTADYNIVVDFGRGLVKEQLSVLDAAVGGVGLIVGESLVHLPPGSQIWLGVALPGFPRFETLATIRHTEGRVGGRCGVHFDHLTEEQQSALSKVVSELLERGQSA